MKMTVETWNAVVAAAKVGVDRLNVKAATLNAARVKAWDPKWEYEAEEFEIDGGHRALMVTNGYDHRDNRGIAWNPATGEVYRVKYIRPGGGRRQMQWSDPLKRWSKLEGKTADEIAEGVGLFKVWMLNYLAKIAQ